MPGWANLIDTSLHKVSLRCAVSEGLLLRTRSIVWPHRDQMAEFSLHRGSSKGGVRELNNNCPCLMSQVKVDSLMCKINPIRCPQKCKPPLHCLMSCGYGHQQYEKKPTLRWMEAVFLCHSWQHNENALCVVVQMHLHMTPFHSVGATLLD